MQKGDSSIERIETDNPAAVLDRLAADFGSAPVRELVEQMAELIDESLEALDRGDHRAVAHRIAGTAGTLGFAAASRVWLAASEDEAIDGRSIRRESARARRIIVQWCRDHPSASTSV